MVRPEIPRAVGARERTAPEPARGNGLTMRKKRRKKKLRVKRTPSLMAALAYRERNWSVFPVMPGEAEPGSGDSKALDWTCDR